MKAGMKETRARYQQGSTREVKRAKGSGQRGAGKGERAKGCVWKGRFWGGAGAGRARKGTFFRRENYPRSRVISDCGAQPRRGVAPALARGGQQRSDGGRDSRGALAVYDLLWCSRGRCRNPRGQGNTQRIVPDEIVAAPWRGSRHRSAS